MVETWNLRWSQWNSTGAEQVLQPAEHMGV